MPEIPDEVEIGPISLKPGEVYSYTAWGIHYKFKGGDWRIAQISFRRKADAEGWMKEKYIKYKGMEGEVVPVKRSLLLEEKGNIKAWVEELG